jgi:hypothetical protein
MKLPIREVLFACALAWAGVLIAAGVSQMHRPSGLIVAGLLLAVWSWVLLAETPRGRG